MTPPKNDHPFPIKPSSKKKKPSTPHFCKIVEMCLPLFCEGKIETMTY